MLVGICGGLCAGKHTVAEYLVQQHGFLRLHLPTKPASLFPDQDEQDAERLLPTVADEKGTRGLTFPDVDALLDFVTKRWREHWVLTDIWDDAILEMLLRRPFFMLISVDAPVGLRYERFSARCAKRSLTPASLAKFISWSDTHLYSPTPETHLGIAYLSSRAHLQILNHFTTIKPFHAYLEKLAVTSPDRLRPTWDAYFMTLASLAAQRSNCMKRRVGCVLATATHRVISTGYNGTPRGIRNCNEGGCDRCNKGPGAGAGLSTCLCLHAEENALLEAGRERIRDGSILYCDTCPCLTCSVKITQVGISEVVFSQSYNMDDASAAIFAEAGVKLRQFSPPRTGLIKFDHDGEASESNGQEMVVRNGH
jgi:dCMP deaminase